jgi:hypothetical protein
MMERSFEMWRRGVRTRKRDCPVWPVRFQGRRLRGEFLLSSYMGGRFMVITTPDNQWLFLSGELEQGAKFVRDHQDRSSPVGWAFGFTPGQRLPTVRPLDLPGAEEEGE